MDKVPNIFHFVFGMSPNFGGKPFSLVHYLAIKSAIVVNNPDTVYLHYQYEPSGEWWEKIKPFLTLNHIQAPAEIFGNKLFHVAHQADVVRLQALKEKGGIYLDSDVICIRPLKDLYKYEFSIGEQYNPGCENVFTYSYMRAFVHSIRTKGKLPKRVRGLCNAVMLSAPESKFVNLWIDRYKTFRSKGKDEFWDEHSVLLPQKIAEDYPDTIKIISPSAFHFPLFDEKGLSMIFKETHSFKKAYLHHLWEGYSWDQYLKMVSVENIFKEDSTYNLIARNFLERKS